MPEESTRQALLREGEEVQRRATSFVGAFIDFALQDNVLEVAIGLILGAAFTKVVTSFISDILLPPLSLLPGLGKNLDEKFVVLRRGRTHAIVNATEVEWLMQKGDEAARGWPAMPDLMGRYGMGKGYNTIKQAQDDGAVVLAWGPFMNTLSPSSASASPSSRSPASISGRRRIRSSSIR